MPDEPDAATFDKSRAELFDALGHPVRIRILHALQDGPLGFSELKRKVGLESSGHLQFHLGKLDGLVSSLEGGSYAITDDGKEALRVVGSANLDDDLRGRGPRRRLRLGSIGRLATVALAMALILGIPFGLYYENSQTTISGLQRSNATMNASLSYYQQLVSSLQGQVADLTSEVNSLQAQYGTMMPYLSTMPSNSSAILLSPQLEESSVKLGGTASLTVELQNTAPTLNNLTGSWDFPSAVGGYLSRPFCGSDMPVGITVLRGHYGSSNATQGEPLAVFDPRPLPCPFPTNYSSIVFYPLSNTALVFAAFSNSSFPSLSLQMSWTFQLKGYWTGNATTAAFTPFESGTYTVVAGDVWGHLAFLYLEVG